jgi:hypothetical protein
MSLVDEAIAPSSRGESIRRAGASALGHVTPVLISAALAAMTFGCHHPETTIEEPYTFSFARSGGFAGVSERITVNSGARAITFDNGSMTRVATANEDDLDTLERALEEADFVHLRGTYECGSCSDQFVYDATLTVGDTTSTIHWEDGSNAPEELFALGMLMSRIRDDYFVQAPQ